MSHLTAEPGDVVTVSGLNLTSDLTVQVDDIDVPFIVTEKSYGTFIMPETSNPNAIGATFFTKDKVAFAQLALVSAQGAVNIPVMDVDPGIVCSDIIYHDPMGKLNVGTRNCSSTVPVCEEEGKVPCVTSNSYVPVNAGSLVALADKIRSGTSIGGVLGTLRDCSVDGDVGCVAVGPTFAAAVTSGASSKIISGQILAGISGTGSTLPASCLSDGATACMATASFPAADRSAFGGADIRSGITIAGVSGLLSGAPGACTTDGATGCITSLNFPAVDKLDKLSPLNAAKIRSSLIIAGVVGTLNDCSSEGAAGCVITGSYAAAQTTGAASKILSGQSIAGVSGNVTLPTAAKVLNATAYGVNGTGTTGTLTLPSAANVKTASALYGETGAQLTPSYSPDFPLAANVRSNDTVDGVTGTLL
ncbi:MAG: hypothetical protein EOP49_28260, partial [Sphingobacteriales bacterium]